MLDITADRLSCISRNYPETPRKTTFILFEGDLVTCLIIPNIRDTGKSNLNVFLIIEVSSETLNSISLCNFGDLSKKVPR